MRCGNYSNYQPKTNFKGTVNVPKLKQLAKQVEPEAVKTIIGNTNVEKLEQFAKEWADIPNDKLYAYFGCCDLNLALKQQNINALFKKQGYTNYEDYRAVTDEVTHKNYNFVKQMANNNKVDITMLRIILHELNGGRMSLNEAYHKMQSGNLYA